MQKKLGGDKTATVALVSKNFWETASVEFKKNYDKLVDLEDDPVEREFAEYRQCLKERDEILER